MTPAMSNYVLQEIEKHNEDFAVRLRDRIVATAKRRPRIAGRGAEKKWTPGATARAVFGRGYLKPVVPKRLRIVKKRKEVSRNQVASSERALAACFAAAHGHIQNLRDALALEVMKAQSQALSALPKAALATLEISFDEMETPTYFNGDLGLFDMLMVHGRLFIADGSRRPKVYELICSPAWLRGKTSAHLLQGILRALPISLARLGQVVDWLNVVVLSDAARACLKVGRHFSARAALTTSAVPAAAPPADGAAAGRDKVFRGSTSMHVLCLMHQLAIVFAMLLTILGILCPLFCACCLVQRGMVRKAIKGTVRALLSQTKCVYVKPECHDDNEAYLRAVLRFLDYADQDSAATLAGETLVFDNTEASQAQRTRLKARDRLARLLAASEISGGIIVKYQHFCPLGCHDSEELAQQEICECAEVAHLDLAVTIPAVNRWTKLFRPMVFWLVGIIFGYLTLAFQAAKDNYFQKFEGLIGALTEEDLSIKPHNRLVGMDSSYFVCFSVCRFAAGEKQVVVIVNSNHNRLLSEALVQHRRRRNLREKALQALCQSVAVAQQCPGQDQDGRSSHIDVADGLAMN